MVNGPAVTLYDAFAAAYDDAFDGRSLRQVYDLLAWEHVEPRLPPAPATIADIGAGTGRWAQRCLDLGHRVICIEPSAAMRDILLRKFAGRNCEVIDATVETAALAEGSLDAALAMGSLQYGAAPDRAVAKVAGWLRPGGFFCAHVDGLTALTLELLRIGRVDEALQRLEERHGVFTYGALEAPLHLFDADALRALLTGAGFAGVEARGLLSMPSAWGRERSAAELAGNEAAYLALERRLSSAPSLADLGKHLMAWGRRP